MMTNLFHCIALSLLGLVYGAVPGDESSAPLFTKKLLGDGGMLGIDPQLAGMIFSVAALATGLLFVLDPMPLAVMYGWNKADPAVVRHSVEWIGASIFATGIAPACMLFKGTDFHTALGITCIFWSIFLVRNLANGTFKKAGLRTDKVIPIAALAFVGVYACFVKPVWALAYCKAIETIYALVAIQQTFFQDLLVDFWGVTVKEDEKPVGKFLDRTFGYSHLQYRIQAYCLLSGVDPAKAMAYGAFSGLAYFLSSFFVTKDIPNVAGKPAAYVYAFWLAFFSFMIPTILLKQ